jgi:hypothetical protein
MCGQYSYDNRIMRSSTNMRFKLRNSMLCVWSVFLFYETLGTRAFHGAVLSLQLGGNFASASEWVLRCDRCGGQREIRDDKLCSIKFLVSWMGMWPHRYNASFRVFVPSGDDPGPRDDVPSQWLNGFWSSTCVGRGLCE